MLTKTHATPPQGMPPVRSAAQQDFRDAMAQLGAAVHVVSTDGPHGRAGFAASAVCSVTDSPPTVLVCLNRGSSAYAATVGNGVICINTLSAGQQLMSAAFSGKLSMPERFTHGQWIARDGCAPALQGAALWIDCRITGRTTVGSHDILICEVAQIEDNDMDSCLIYYNRQYHPL